MSSENTDSKNPESVDVETNGMDPSAASELRNVDDDPVVVCRQPDTMEMTVEHVGQKSPEDMAPEKSAVLEGSSHDGDNTSEGGATAAAAAAAGDAESALPSETPIGEEQLAVDVQEYTMDIPPDRVGAIIGTRGSVIVDMQQRTGTKMVVLQVRGVA